MSEGQTCEVKRIQHHPRFQKCNFACANCVQPPRTVPLFPQFPEIRKEGDKEDKKQHKWTSGHDRIRHPAKPPTKPGQNQGSASASKAHHQLQAGCPAPLLTQTKSSGVLLQRTKILSGSICTRSVSVNTSRTNQGTS